MSQPTYSLLIRGLESGYQDHLARPISHTVVWEGHSGEEPQFRALVLEAIAGNLSLTLAAAIRPDSKDGFHVDFERIKSAVATSQENLRVPADRRTDCTDIPMLLHILRTQRLPDLAKLGPLESVASTVLVAIGPGHTKLSQTTYPHCRLTIDWYKQI